MPFRIQGREKSRDLPTFATLLTSSVFSLKSIEMAFEFTDTNFQETALESGVSVVDFWAEWCGPCRMIGPIIEELASDFDGKVTVGKLNVDHNPEVSMKYGIRSIPTILIFKDGQPVEKIVGVTTKQNLSAKIEAQLS
jgi:thioredoxin 1